MDKPTATVMDNQQAAALLDEISDLIGSTTPSNPDSESDDADSATISLGMIQEAQQFQRYAQTYRSDRANWLVVGTFNNGKSTLINALLGVEAVLMGAVPTTAVITHLSQGQPKQNQLKQSDPKQDDLKQDETLRIKVHPRSGEPFSLKPDDYWNHYGLSAKTNWDEIDRIDITGVFEQLPAGVTLIDTPGLAEDRLRTALALRYLPHASAVIVVIDAMQPLSKAERDFIALLGPGQLQNVFFVINRIDLLPSGDLSEVKDWIQKRLNSHFCDPEGHFADSLYHRRVFFTNSLAPNANSSGVLSLRQALVALLDADDQPFSAKLQPLVPVLADVLHNARQRMTYRLSALAQPLEILAAQVTESQERLTQMQRDSEALQQRVSRASNVIKHLIYNDLVQYTQAMQSTWEQDFERLELDQLASTNIFSVKFNDRDKTALANALSHELQRYMQLKLIEWAKRLPQALQGSVNDLLEDIRYDLRSFQLELDEIASLTEGAARSQANRRGAGLLQIDQTLYAEIFNDQTLLQLVRPMADQILADLPSNKKFKKIGLTIARAVLDAGSLLSWVGQGGFRVIGLVSQMGGSLIGQIQRQQEMDELSGRSGEDDQKLDETYENSDSKRSQTLENAVRANLVVTLKSPLFEQIHSAIVDRREVIFQQVETEFEGLGSAIGQQLTAAVDEVHQTQQDLLAARRTQQDSLAESQTRHQAIEQSLRTRIDALCTAVIARPLSDLEIEQLSDHRAVFLPPTARTDAVALDPHTPIIAEKLTLTPPPAIPGTPSTAPLNTRLLNAVQIALGLDPIADDDGDLSTISTDLANMTGLGGVKQRVLELMAFHADIQRRQQSGLTAGTPPSLHLVFTGNPGTGKTTVAETIGKMYRRLGLLKSGHLRSITRADLVGAYIGHSERKVRKVVEEACDGVLFVDEAYTLVKEDSPNDFGMVALEELMRCMETYRGRLAVVVAGYPAQMENFLRANPGLMSRFPPDNVIHLPDYEPADLQQILQQMLAKDSYRLSPDAQTQITQVIAGLYAGRDKRFGNAREMRNLAQTLIRRRAARIQPASHPVDEPIQAEDINDYYRAYISDCPEQSDHTEAVLARIRQMIGLGSVKETIDTLVARSQISIRLGEPVRADTLHMLFRGAPGTGKTTVAEQLGKVLHSLGYLQRGHLVAVSRGDLVGEYIGKSEKKIRDVLEDALDGVLLIDEAYSLFVDDTANDYGRVVLNELTAYLDQHRDRLVVILAGYPDEIDALVHANPGLRDRFRTPLDFQNYTSQELIQIGRKMANDDGYQLTEAAEERITFYLDRKRAADPDRFGNARAVRVLLDEMKGRLALRIQALSIDTLDDTEFRKLAKRLEDKDVPPLPKFTVAKARRMTVILDTRGRPLSVSPLDIDIVPAAADVFR